MAKLQEFQTLKSLGYITVPFSVVWSQDNFLAYVTDRGVNVFELRFSGMNPESSVIVKRWFIKPRHFFPTYDCLINVAKLGETLHPDQLFKLILDRTLSPKACLSGPAVHASAIAWLPFSHHLSEASLLCILSDQGSLDIYSYGETCWQHRACVTESWLGICRKQWDNKSIQDHSPNGIVEELKMRAYRVKITAFSWGRCHNDKWFTLFTGNLSGEIMEWKIELTESGVNITSTLVLKTDLDAIGCLHCLSLSDESSMLLMGCASGKVQCMAINNSVLKTKSMLWSDLDQMPVPLNGPIGTLLPEGILYLVPKMGHLLVFWLDSDANLINFTTYSTDDICISGIEWLKGSEFVVTTRNGDVLSVYVSFSSGSLDITVGKCEPFSKNNGCSYHGITVSTNKCIFAVPYSVCTPHDPSVLKEPTTLALFHTGSRLTYSEYLHFKVENFYKAWDYLELFRLDVLNKKEIDIIEEESMDIYDFMDVVTLKKVYWLKKCQLLSFENYNTEAYITPEALCNELKRSIISYYLFARIKTLIATQNLSDKDRESLVCAKLWLKKYCADGLLKSYRKKAEILIQSLNSIDLQEKESCPLCDKECQPIGPELTMACSQGHLASRCPRTLLPLITPPYYTCFYCIETSTYGDKEFKICIMCDAPLRFNKLMLRE